MFKLRQLELEEVLRYSRFVTVETVDGDVHVGTLVAVSFEHVKVVSGVQGKPVILHVDDIEMLLPVCPGNPHIEARTSQRIDCLAGAR